MNKIFKKKYVAIACILLIAIAATFISITGITVLQYKGCIDANDYIRNVNLSIEPKCNPNEKIVKWYEIGYMGEHGLKGLQGLEGYHSDKRDTGDTGTPTTPVSQGYIQSFDNNLNYGFEYPETWTMHSPDEFSYTQGVKKVDMFTKPSEGTSITIIAKTSIWKDTKEAKSVWQEVFNGVITNETDLNVNNLKGYEITLDESGTKSKMAIFIVDGMAYEFDYIGAVSETSFKTSEIIFDHVVNSFNVK